MYHIQGGGGESAASFCRQVSALVPDMFCNFYEVKNHKIVKKNSTTTKSTEKISTDLEALKFLGVCLTKILLHIISHRFLLTTKLLIG
jgi:hypothetical protein